MQPAYVDRSEREIEHPNCVNCGAPMWLTRIEPLGGRCERWIFECQACGRSEIETVDSR